MFCNNCGKQIENGEQVCKNCGNNLSYQYQTNNNQNQYQNNQGQMNQYNNQMPPKKNNGIVIVIVVIVLLLAISGVVRVLFANGTSNFLEKIEDQLKDNIEDINEEDDEDNIIENIVDGQRVGTEESGYVTIPKDWVKFVDPDAPDTLQYNGDIEYVLTMVSNETSKIRAKDVANSLMVDLESDDVQDLTGATVKIGKYTSYQVYGYYPIDKVWLVVWVFEAEDERTHYIALEGPDRKSEHFLIPDTFSLEK